ncbi:hypothetical protein VKT23_003428 [Stygiomarasmius scandens]|uniref:Uncharacterized protein n=1 Tax=Marasmiellus scandens TaxID=2682957 RepID=A0ABR1K1H5_9AGAR
MSSAASKAATHYLQFDIQWASIAATSSHILRLCLNIPNGSQVCLGLQISEFSRSLRLLSIRSACERPIFAGCFGTFEPYKVLHVPSTTANT